MTTKKVLKQIDLDHYGSWAIRGGYGDEKTRTMTVRINSDLESRIKDFIDHPKSNYWNKGELIRSALTLYLDTFESQHPKKKKEGS